MLEWLKTPTDSLYKFMAICGLIGFLTCLILPQIAFNSLEQQIPDAAEAAMNKLIPQIQREVDEQSKEQIDHIEQTNLREALRIPEGERSRIVVIRIDESKLLTSELEIAATQLERMLWFYGVGGAISLAMCLIGFYLWYSREQKLQDQLLSTKALSAASAKK